MIVRSTLTDPVLNLAVEEHLFASLTDEEPVLLLYTNGPSVVVGRHQNPWLECNLAAMRADGVPVARRVSGGGAVYHDPGNTNYSFLASATHYDTERHFTVLLNALSGFGIPAERGPRHDLWVAGRKCSGTAFRHVKNRSLHHGTVLIDADLDALERYLHGPLPDGISSRGIASVRSRVINLTTAATNLTVESLWDEVERQYRDVFGIPRSVDALEVDRDWVAARPEIGELAEQRRDWEWTFGHSPPFEVRVPVLRRPERTYVVSVRRGRIAAIATGDAGPPTPRGAAEVLHDVLQGVRFTRDDIRQADFASAGDGSVVAAVEAISEAAVW